MNSVIVEDPKRQRLVFFSIAFASFMVNVDTYIVNISLPTLARYFHAPASDVSWVVLSYQLAVTSLLLIFGKLGDRIGLKKVFLAGFTMFTASSVLCGCAPTLFILVLARFIQGIGASMLYALTPAMIPRFLPEKIRGPAFGALATATLRRRYQNAVRHGLLRCSIALVPASRRSLAWVPWDRTGPGGRCARCPKN